MPRPGVPAAANRPIYPPDNIGIAARTGGPLVTEKNIGGDIRTAAAPPVSPITDSSMIRAERSAILIVLTIVGSKRSIGVAPPSSSKASR